MRIDWRDTVIVEDTVSVSIGSREEPDHELVMAFLDWQIENDVLPLKGTGSSGLGRSFATFRAENAAAIEAFFDAWFEAERGET